MVNYIGTVFEILAIGLFARHGLLLEYKPVVGLNRADGLAEMNGESFLIEATVVTQSPYPEVAGAVDWKRMVRMIREDKVLDKAKQLRDSEIPIEPTGSELSGIRNQAATVFLPPLGIAWR